MALQVSKSDNTNGRRKFYRRLVKHINSCGEIRVLHASFVKERRTKLKQKINTDHVIDDYFRCCKKNVFLLESVRRANFDLIKFTLSKLNLHDQKYQQFVKALELNTLMEKIDYERACRRGIFGRKHQ